MVAELTLSLFFLRLRPFDSIGKSVLGESALNAVRAGESVVDIVALFKGKYFSDKSAEIDDDDIDADDVDADVDVSPINSLAAVKAFSLKEFIHPSLPGVHGKDDELLDVTRGRLGLSFFEMLLRGLILFFCIFDSIS